MIGTSKAWFCGQDGSIYELTGQGGGSWFPSYGKNFTYTGEYVIVPENDTDWKVKFLTSGTFTATDALLIDVFAVGGGGGGGVSSNYLEYAGTDGGQSSGFGSTANGGKCCGIHTNSGSKNMYMLEREDLVVVLVIVMVGQMVAMVEHILLMEIIIIHMAEMVKAPPHVSLESLPVICMLEVVGEQLLQYGQVVLIVVEKVVEATVNILIRKAL